MLSVRSSKLSLFLQYPNLIPLAPRLVDVFLMFSAGGHHSALSADSEAPEKSGELGRVSSKLISTRLVPHFLYLFSVLHSVVLF